MEQKINEKPTVYIIDDSFNQLEFANATYNLKIIDDIIHISSLKSKDLIFWHLGLINSSSIHKYYLQYQLDVKGVSTKIITTEQICCFSRNSTDEKLWDKNIKSVFESINKNSFGDIDFKLFTSSWKSFQDHLSQSIYKPLFRCTIGGFLLSNFKLNGTSVKSNYSENIKTFFDTSENYIKYFNTPPYNELRKKTVFDSSHSIYFEELLLACSSIKENLNYKNLELEFIPHTLFFRPSQQLWKYLGALKNKIYIFFICPWRSPDNFLDIRNEGFNHKEHNNIILWNPLEGLDKLRILIEQVSKDQNMKKVRDHEFYLNIKNKIFKNINLDKYYSFTQFIYPIAYFQHPLNDLFKNCDSEMKAVLLFDFWGNNYDQHTHDSNSKNDTFDNEFQIQHQIFTLRQRCSDTLESLKLLENLKTEINLAILDDKPADDIIIGSYNIIEILKLFSKDKFVPKFPKIKLSDFEDIKKYESILEKPELLVLNEFINSDVILSDLLFHFNENEVEFKYFIKDGIKFISGLNRVIRDKFQKIEGKPLPSIIAFSQDTNPKTITNSLKAGAKDYAFKNRPFFLPASIIKAKLTTGDQTTTYHRNFRSTYNLNNEVIGLLQTIKVDSPNLGKVDELNRIGSLLNVLPKTDLHVHVGSCMSNEFLILASFISLLRLDYIFFEKTLKELIKLYDEISIPNNEIEFKLPFFEDNLTYKTTSKFWVDDLAVKIKKNIITKIEELIKDDSEGGKRKELKSYFHHNYKIPDYIEDSKLVSSIEKISNFEISFKTVKNTIDADLIFFDCVRVFILSLAQKYPSSEMSMFESNFRYNYFDYFTNNDKYFPKDHYDKLNDMFFNESGSFSVEMLRSNGWHLNVPNDKIFKIALPYDKNNISLNKNPIGYILSTGTRSSNLVEYLEGCEYSGAEHLQHPYLIHLYARQAIYNFIDYGICYTELRGSPSGYVNHKIGFGFTDVMNCFITAFNQSQEEVKKVFYKAIDLPNTWKTFSFTKNLKVVFNKDEDPFSKRLHFNEDAVSSKRLPCKVNLIITGKRHKPLRDMIMEAAIAASLKKNNNSKFRTSKDFANYSFSKMEVVGFDLAGKEEGNPPEKFLEEFSRLSKLHTPLTIHAGENASSEFIESAVLKVGARRIGHGLALAEDKDLMYRLREQRVCIELCPVCNHQTSHFEGENGRPYPLKEYLDCGLLVCINTDNPIISDTNILKEYIKASKVMRDHKTKKGGLSVWDALRIMRMGFVTSFMELKERKYILEIVDQHIYDIFNNPIVIEHLYNLAHRTEKTA